MSAVSFNRPELASLEAATLDLPPMGETASGKPWRLRPYDRREALAIEQQAQIEPEAARVLAARGITAANAQSYLNPSLRDAMPDPFVLADMEKAAARLAKAVIDGEGIGIFGDYDVDGTTAAAMLSLYFEAIGVHAQVYLPDRIIEGYGPNIEAFRELARGGAKVIVTVDCGAAAHKVIEEAAADGMDVVVIDHHQMSGPPPEGAVAVVNPNRLDDISGLTNLSAAGVAFMALVALNRALRAAGFFKERPEPDLRRYLDLAALGLVCDVMEMTGLTRTLVAQGLKVMGAGGNAGLAALGERAGVKGAPSSYHLGFLLGPRINAAGRIGHARLAHELMTSRDPSQRLALAERLHLMNAQRQEIEAAVLEEAAIAAERFHNRDIVVVAGEGWHPGVIGIVAGRLKETLDKPVIVIGLEGDTGKGSGRSITGVDLGAGVAAAREEGLLIAGGGHAMAAGLTVARSALDAFTEFLNDRLGPHVGEARASRRLEIDAIVAPSAVTKHFADIIERAGPYGPGNPEPIFALTNMRPEYVKPVGKDHLSMTLVSESGEKVRAIAFRAVGAPLGDMLAGRTRVHVAGRIRADDWRGGDAAQLQISDAAIAL